MRERFIRRLATGRGRVAVIVGLVMLAIGAVALLPLIANPAPARRDITLVAREMAFHIEGDSASNPTLRLRAGERIRLVLRNDDPGYTHWLAIEPWGVAIGPLVDGESAAVELKIPGKTERIEYTCTPHARMMRGTVEVLQSSRSAASEGL